MADSVEQRKKPRGRLDHRDASITAGHIRERSVAQRHDKLREFGDDVRWKLSLADSLSETDESVENLGVLELPLLAHAATLEGLGVEEWESANVAA